jgi:hypothetical protein
VSRAASDLTNNPERRAAVKNWPTDPMRQHNRFVAAFCDDLFDMCMNGGSKTPNADRVMEINRQVNEVQQEREAANNRLPVNHG